MLTYPKKIFTGRIERAIIYDMLNAFDFRIEEILGKYGFKLENKSRRYDSENFIKNKYKFHIGFNGVIKEYTYTEK